MYAFLGDFHVPQPYGDLAQSRFLSQKNWFVPFLHNPAPGHVSLVQVISSGIYLYTNTSEEIAGLTFPGSGVSRNGPLIMKQGHHSRRPKMQSLLKLLKVLRSYLLKSSLTKLSPLPRPTRSSGSFTSIFRLFLYVSNITDSPSTNLSTLFVHN